jgi:hypothetical protein
VSYHTIRKWFGSRQVRPLRWFSGRIVGDPETARLDGSADYMPNRFVR